MHLSNLLVFALAAAIPALAWIPQQPNNMVVHNAHGPFNTRLHVPRPAHGPVIRPPHTSDSHLAKRSHTNRQTRIRRRSADSPKHHHKDTPWSPKVHPKAKASKRATTGRQATRPPKVGHVHRRPRPAAKKQHPAATVMQKRSPRKQHSKIL